MNIGDSFRPYKMFCGAIIPNWLLCRMELSQGAKLTYARMSQYFGKDGTCTPQQDTLAKSIGSSERRVHEYIQELVTCGLIKSIRRGLGLSNSYSFLWHKWIENPEPSDLTVLEPPKSSTGTARSDGSRTAGSDGSANYDKENHLRESQNGSGKAEQKESTALTLEAEKLKKPPVPKPLTATQLRIGKLYRRRENTRWTPGELKALKQIEPIPEEELAIIETYYTADIPADQNFRRRDMATLLNNWSGEVDRARNFKPKQDFNL